MKVHLLGTAGYHPNEARHTACCMVPECGLVLDAGTGFFRARKLVQTDTLHVFLSHAHLDHCAGLTFFLDIRQGRELEFQVYGEEEKLEAIRGNLFSPLIFPLDPGFAWTPLGRSVELPNGPRVTAFPLVHPGNSLGFRIDWPDRSMAYVTDTTADLAAPYLQEIAGVDLLLHECYFPDGNEELAQKTGHSCLTPVAEISRAADVGRTVLIHTNPLCEQAEPLDLKSVASIYDRISVGADGQIIEF